MLSLNSLCGHEVGVKLRVLDVALELQQSEDGDHSERRWKLLLQFISSETRIKSCFVLFLYREKKPD